MFICVLRSGGIYHAGHVERLQKQLNRPLTCLSDVSFDLPDVRRLPLIYHWKGWWSKIELFRMVGPLVYLDLDVDIVGNPDELYREEFTMWADPFYPNGFNSSVMAWGQFTPRNVLGEFYKDPKSPEKKYRKWPKAGDQGFIQDHVDNIQKFPDGMILSYKAHVKKGTPTDNAVVIAYHGKPKPWDL